MSSACLRSSFAFVLAVATFAGGCASEDEVGGSTPGGSDPTTQAPGSSSGGTAPQPGAPSAAPGAVDPGCLVNGYGTTATDVTAVFAGDEGAIVIAGTERVGLDRSGKLGATGRSANSSSYIDLKPLPGGGLLSLDANNLTTWDAAGKALASVAVANLLVTPSQVLTIDGGYVVIGNEKAAATQNKRVIGVQKLSPSGAPDATFGDKGIARLPSTEDLRFEGAKLAPDGSIWIRGSAKLFVPFVAKLSAGGQLDAGFGTSGVAILERMGTRASRDLVFAKDGSAFVLGMTGDAPQITKLLANGTADATFGNGGLAELRVTKPLSSKYDEQVESKALLLQDDGKLLVVSSYEWDDGEDKKLEEQSLMVLRLAASGALDASFGDAGQARVTLGAAARPSTSWAKPGAAIVGSRLLVGGTTYTELGSKGTRAGGLVCLAL